MVSRPRPTATRATGNTRRGSDEETTVSNDRGRTGARMTSVIATAKAELAELTGRSVGTATAVHRAEDQWRLTLEVVELERIPASTNIIGSYDVRADREGHLLEYNRTHRYHRNQADDSDGS